MCAIFEVLMNTNMKHICYFVFKSFVDNCQLCNFVGTEMDAENDNSGEQNKPSSCLYALRILKKRLKVRFTSILATNIY